MLKDSVNIDQLVCTKQKLNNKWKQEPDEQFCKMPKYTPIFRTEN